MVSEYDMGWNAAVADHWAYGRTYLNPAARAAHTDAPEWIKGYEAFMSTI